MNLSRSPVSPSSRNLRHWVMWVGIGTLVSAFSSNPVFLGNPVYADEQLERFEFLQIRMGIPVNIVLYARNQDIANQASDAAYRRFRELDRTFSDYDPDSELMQLCTTAQPGQPVDVSEDLFNVLMAAQQYSQQTQGAFDITVGPVVKLWRVARRRKQLPDQKRLAAALAAVGQHHVQLDESQRTVTLLQPNMKLDLGGIAKGFAADEALRTMAGFGVTRVLIDAGGDIVAGDPPPGRKFWRIEVEKLRRTEDRAKPSVIQLANAAVATSGDTYQFLEIDGQRYSHLVDPHTGIGLTTPSSVTVIAPTGMAADALASAVSVMGPQRGLQLIASIPEAEVLIVQVDTSEKAQTLDTPVELHPSQRSNTLQEFASPGYSTYLEREAPDPSSPNE